MFFFFCYAIIKIGDDIVGVYRDQLEAELRELERQLKANRTVKVRDVKWTPGVQDSSYSETYDEVYVHDNDKDSYLVNRISEIRKKLSEPFEDYTREELERQKEKRAYESYKRDNEKVRSKAMEIYERELAEYRAKKPLARLFAKKKPPKLGRKATKNQKMVKALETYGDQAIEEILEEGKAFENVDFKKRQEVKAVKNYYKDDPEAMAEAIAEIEERYAKLLDDLRKSFREIVDHNIERYSNNSGKGGRK